MNYRASTTVDIRINKKSIWFSKRPSWILGQVFIAWVLSSGTLALSLVTRLMILLLLVIACVTVAQCILSKNLNAAVQPSAHQVTQQLILQLALVQQRLCPLDILLVLTDKILTSENLDIVDWCLVVWLCLPLAEEGHQRRAAVTARSWPGKPPCV